MNLDVMDLLAGRRTVRRYSDQPISPAELESLLLAAFYAPSYLNRKPGHFLVLQDKELQEQLGSILGVRPYVQQAAAVIVLLGDPAISNSWEIDLAAAVENILIVATGLGLGAAWVGNPHGAAWETRVDQIRDLLDIPKHIQMLGLVTVGHPDEEKESHSPTEWDETRVHYDRFSNLRPVPQKLSADAVAGS